MATEIERKYLIKEDLLNLPAEGNRIVQGYLWSEKGKSMRIRITKDKGFLTIKTGTNPLSGENKGLVIAEIELESEDQEFEKPEWLGLEVTQDKRYLNVNLINQPISLW